MENNTKETVYIVGKVTNESLPMIVQKFAMAERCLRNAGYENIINPAKTPFDVTNIKFSIQTKFDILYVTDDWPDDKLSVDIMICSLAERKKILWLARLQRQINLL